MFPSWLQILLVVMLALIFFGRGKISDFMTDLASGIKSLEKACLMMMIIILLSRIMKIKNNFHYV